MNSLKRLNKCFIQGYIKIVHARSVLECAMKCSMLLNNNKGICKKAYYTSQTGNDKYGKCTLFSPCPNANRHSETEIEASGSVLTYYKEEDLSGKEYSIEPQQIQDIDRKGILVH